MNQNTKNEIQRAEKKNDEALNEIEKAIGKEWHITFSCEWGVMETEKDCILWTEESFLGFNKTGNRFGFCFENIELPLTTEFFIGFAKEAIKLECSNEHDEVRLELAKTLSAYFSAKQICKKPKTKRQTQRGAQRSSKNSHQE